MKLASFILMLSAPLASLALIPTPAAAQQEVRQAWTNTVTLTPQGSFLVGNRNAKTKLVEYVSYTCPHCAHFVKEGTVPLKAQWVNKGTTSIEIRNLVRDRFDLTAALLARCGGPARFNRQHEALFANHEAWIEKASAYTPSLPANATPAQAMADIAEKTGLIALMQKLGTTPAQSKACIADSKAMEQLLAMTQASKGEGVTGTPSFLINGKLTDAHDWASLRPLLPAPAK
ncbi:MAG: protein-disulfide isomerase [Sphingobium sp.]|nr:protein-disulfide isomerase [Sphingobium sp.]